MALFLSQPSHQGARQILTLLQGAKGGDYSYRYLRQKVPGAAKGLRDLLRREWVESYLEPPKAVRPQLPKMVTLLNFDSGLKLTELQQRALTVLKNQGGELWLADLLKTVPCSASTIQSLEKKDLLAIAEREKLRFFDQPQVNPSQAPELTPAQAQAYQDPKSPPGLSPGFTPWGDRLRQNRSLSANLWRSPQEWSIGFSVSAGNWFNPPVN